MRIFVDQRGSVLLFTVVMLTCLLMFGALAIDLAYMMSAKGEVQRSIDAAALAGAGKLAFDSSVFDAVRTAAQTFAAANHFRTSRGGTVTLAQSDIEVGVWRNSQFAPWDAGADPNGQQVNAVRCRFQTPIPMSFLGLLGFTSMNVGAIATAIANPPVTVPCDTPLLPLAVTQCSFQDGGTGAFTSQGCGTGLTFIRSNTQCNNQAGSPQSCNTATWANLSGSGTPNPGYLNSTIQNAANGGGACGGGGILTSGQQAGTNNGMVDSTFKVLADTFVANRSATLSEDVCPAGGCDGSAPLYRKEGGGWEVAVAMIRTPCPPGAMSGTYEVLTFTKFVITQIFYKQDGCEIAPNPDPQARTYCYNPDGSKRKDNDLRAVFGYFRCDRLGEVASRDPLPRTALATRLRLVQ